MPNNPPILRSSLPRLRLLWWIAWALAPMYVVFFQPPAQSLACHHEEDAAFEPFLRAVQVSGSKIVADTENPLIAAIQSGNLKLVKKLLYRGARINVLGQQMPILWYA